MPKLTPFHNTYKATGVADADAQDVVLIHGWGLPVSYTHLTLPTKA